MIDHHEVIALVDRVVGCKSGAPVRLLSEPESAVGHTLKRKFFELLQEVSGSPDEHSI
jgi:hypothetical protein